MDPQKRFENKPLLTRYLIWPMHRPTYFAELANKRLYVHCVDINVLVVLDVLDNSYGTVPGYVLDLYNVHSRSTIFH